MTSTATTTTYVTLTWQAYDRNELVKLEAAPSR